MPGDKDAGSGGDPLRLALDALQDSGRGQLIPEQALPGHLVPALLPPVHLPEQRHQPGHLQRHVAEISHGVQEAVPLWPPAHGEAGLLQCGSDLQRHQGDVQRGKSGPLPHGNGRGAKHTNESIFVHWHPAQCQEDTI